MSDEHMDEMEDEQINEEMPEEETEALEDTEEEVEEVEEDPIEAEARAQGWNPNGPKSAQQFIDDGHEISLKKAISSKNDQISNLERQIGDLKEMLTTQQTTAYKAAIQDLQQQRDIAIQEGDVDGVYQVEDQIRELGQGIQKSVQQANKGKGHNSPAVQEFYQKHHAWIYENSDEANDMKVLAEATFMRHLNNGRSEYEAVAATETALARTFPHRFKQHRASPRRAVEAGNTDAASRVATAKSKSAAPQLDNFQKAVGRQLVERGVYKDLSEYAKALKNDKKGSIDIKF